MGTLGSVNVVGVSSKISTAPTRTPTPTRHARLQSYVRHTLFPGEDPREEIARIGRNLGCIDVSGESELVSVSVSVSASWNSSFTSLLILRRRSWSAVAWLTQAASDECVETCERLVTQCRRTSEPLRSSCSRSSLVRVSKQLGDLDSALNDVRLSAENSSAQRDLQTYHVDNYDNMLQVYTDSSIHRLVLNIL